MSPASATEAALARVVAGECLSAEEMTCVFREIMAGVCTRAQLGGLLVGLAQRGETMAEIVGAARAMREVVRPVMSTRSPLLDTCGTGGSGVARRNVSTAVALCLAACGVAVAKHGNRAASSRCGSADVLEALGVNVEASPEVVGRCIDEAGIGFLFARTLHPAMAHAAPVRRDLKVRTLFNLLGPLTNPAGATRQLLGVYDPRRCLDLAGALGELGSERVLVIHGFRAGDAPGEDAPAGIDDVSPEGATLVAEWDGTRVSSRVLTPADFGLEPSPLADLAGGDPADNAAALTRLLAGAPGPYRHAVQLAGALALIAAGEGGWAELPALAERIARTLDDGSARQVLSDLARTSRETWAGP